jgi:hypothetical protein
MKVVSQWRRIAAAAALGAAAHAAMVYVFRRERNRLASDRRHVLVTQGGQRLRLAAKETDDAVVSVLMGGAVLHLGEEGSRSVPARIDVLIVMGGVQLIVPQDWIVRVEVDALMGGVDDRRGGRAGAHSDPDLVICGRVIMGGLEISAHGASPGRSAACQPEPR